MKTLKILFKVTLLLGVYLLFMLMLDAFYERSVLGSEMGVPPSLTEPPIESEPNGKGRFYFRVRIRDHMYNARTWLAEVRTFPADGNFPNVKVEDNGTIIENADRVILAIRGIEVPPAASDFNAWHQASEREEERYDTSMHHTWKLLSAAETGIIENPKDIGGIVEGIVYLVIGGVELNLGESLVHDGFAMNQTENGIDWRQRIPRERD